MGAPQPTVPVHRVAHVRGVVVDPGLRAELLCESVVDHRLLPAPRLVERGEGATRNRLSSDGSGDLPDAQEALSAGVSVPLLQEVEGVDGRIVVDRRLLGDAVRPTQVHLGEGVRATGIERGLVKSPDAAAVEEPAVGDHVPLDDDSSPC